MIQFIYSFLFFSFSSLLEIYFFHHFVGVSMKKIQYLEYLFLFFGLLFCEDFFSFSPFLSLVSELILLFCFGHLILTCSIRPAFIGAILTITIIYLNNSISNIVTDLIFRWHFSFSENISYYSILISSIGLLLTAFTYWYIKSFFSIGTNALAASSFILTFPILLILFTSQFITNIIYGNKVENPSAFERISNSNQFRLLGLHILGYICLFSVLYIYRSLIKQLEIKAQVDLLTQQTLTQQIYIKEAQARYEQTRSFRHDMKNHLLILDSLLKQEQTKKAQAYLKQLQNISNELSFPCKTGNTTIDVLLNSKLTFAIQNKIQTSCILNFPAACSIQDIDLCIVFSNALDNAIHACMELPIDKRFLSLSSKQQGNFLLIEIKNSYQPKDKFLKPGIGISNIQKILEKYHGTMQIETKEQTVCISMLFIIS